MTLHKVTDLNPSGQDSPEQPNEPNAKSAVSTMLSLVGDLMSESALAHEQFLQARHDQAQADQYDDAAELAGKEAAEAKARVLAEKHKAGSHKQVNRKLGTLIAVILALLDVVPAYWTAQAFGLDQVSTVVLAALLCAALGGAMWLLDLFVDKGRRVAARVLGCALGAGFVGIFVLRLDYLMVIGGSGILAAGIQALALTGLSAALVAVGFVLLSHRIPKEVANAQDTARRVGRNSDQHVAAELHNKAAMSRAALTDTVVTWVLAHEQTHIGPEELLGATDDAIAILLRRH
jgi:hypothetical protein